MSKVKFKGFAFVVLSRRLLCSIKNSTQHTRLTLTDDGELALHAAILRRLLGARVVLNDVPKSHHFVDLKVTHGLHLARREKERRKIEDYRKIALESKPKLSNVMRLSSLTNGHRSVKSLRPYENAALCCVSEKIAITKIVNLIFRNVDILQ